MSKIYLVDASSIFYKAFFGIPMLNSKNGVPTNAAYGFTNTMLSLLKKYDPKYVAVCFDSRSDFRKTLYADYKSERKPMNNNLTVQIPIIKQVTEALGLTALEVSGYEADDIIGMMTKLATDSGKEVVIVSPDKDLCQLVSPSVTVLNLSKKMIFDEAKVKEDFGISPNQIVDMLGLCGDPSDSIPGVLGIGKGTGLKLILEYGSIEGIYQNLDKLKDGVRKKLEAGRVSSEISKKLATLITENKTKIENVEQLERVFVNKPELLTLFDALNFISLKGKIEDLE